MRFTICDLRFAIAFGDLMIYLVSAIVVHCDGRVALVATDNGRVELVATENGVGKTDFVRGICRHYTLPPTFLHFYTAKAIPHDGEGAVATMPHDGEGAPL